MAARDLALSAATVFEVALMFSAHSRSILTKSHRDLHSAVHAIDEAASYLSRCASTALSKSSHAHSGGCMQPGRLFRNIEDPTLIRSC